MLLRQPGSIGSMRLKNRIVMAPMGTNYGTSDGFSTDRDKRYYGERAKGGVAMIVTEAMNVSAGARNHTNSLCVFHDRFIPGLNIVVQAIHDNGALAVAQLNHRGQLLRRSVLGMEPVGPSAGRNPATGDAVRGLSVEEIHAIQRDFLDASSRVRWAGYDAVEIHAANGYLFHQFFSERFNRRTDQYGGSRENRMRLLRETVTRIQDELRGFPVIVRLSATEYIEGGYSEEDIIALAQALEQEGVVAIDLSGGSNENPQLSRYCIQPPSFPRRCLEPHARPIKHALNIPVIIAGRILTPEDAEAVLEAGSADFVSLGRALLADPHWCAKAFGEVDAPIRTCISCNVCLERLTLERDVACVQNPLVGTEFETLECLEPQLSSTAVSPEDRRRILVIGGGVAGAEAARMAAGLGHSVEIWEQSGAAGGQMALALAAPHKEDVSAIWTYREASLIRLGVPIRLHALVTAGAIRAHAPDVVFVATGARPRALTFALDVHVPVLQSWHVLLNPGVIAPGAAVTIIGGGMVGIETADLLVTRGCRVTVIELEATVAREMARNNRAEVLLRLDEHQTRILTDAAIERVVDGRIVVKRQGEEIRVDPGDAVIVAIGPEPNRDVVPAIEASGVPYVLIGDCNQPGDFLTAIRDASMAALAVSQSARGRLQPASLATLNQDVT
jgi:2,4-dienoyl-CoA reductase-like NADH-dependent reductase (Old Yellow Enzyme family)/thioredoxin reductase